MVRLGNLTKLQCSGVSALIIVDVHARDVVSTMVVREINSDTHFEWLKQLRYYWDNEDGCVAYSINGRWLYAFEYLGSSPRLVITPLTDRCYLCLMGALQLSLGCVLSGPTGTGKTETVKDLAKALATQCIIFNCSDGLNYKVNRCVRLKSYSSKKKILIISLIYLDNRQIFFGLGSIRSVVLFRRIRPSRYRSAIGHCTTANYYHQRKNN